MENYSIDFDEYERQKGKLIEGEAGTVEDLVQPMPAERMEKYLKCKISENFDPLQAHEICITFSPMFWNKISTPEMACKCLERRIRKIMEGMRKCPCRPAVLLIHEYSDSGMFHYHGLIQGLNKTRLFALRNYLNKYYGRTKIGYIKNYPAYVDYMLKGVRDPDGCPDDYHSMYLNIYINMLTDADREIINLNF